MRPAEHLATTAAALAVTALIAWRGLLPTPPAGDVGPRFALPHGQLVVLAAVALIALMAEGAMGDRSAVYIRMDLGAASTAANGFAAFSLTMAIGRLTGDRLVARLGAVALLVGAIVVGATSLERRQVPAAALGD